MKLFNVFVIMERQNQYFNDVLSLLNDSYPLLCNFFSYLVGIIIKMAFNTLLINPHIYAAH